MSKCKLRWHFTGFLFPGRFWNGEGKNKESTRISSDTICYKSNIFISFPIDKFKPQLSESLIEKGPKIVRQVIIFQNR